MLSMRMLSQVITGDTPFQHASLPSQVIFAVVGGQRPEPGTLESGSLAAALWLIAQKCWHERPEARGTTSEIFEALCSLRN